MPYISAQLSGNALALRGNGVFIISVQEIAENDKLTVTANALNNEIAPGINSRSFI